MSRDRGGVYGAVGAARIAAEEGRPPLAPSCSWRSPAAGGRAGRREDPHWAIRRDPARSLVGANCKIQSHTFICDGVTIEDEVFVGHGVMFVNDRRPRATNDGGELQAGEWELLPTVVERGASLGSGAVILGGLRVGAGALVGAGAVVTRDVEPGTVVAGTPARPHRLV